MNMKNNILFLVGASGSGKSVIAKRVAENNNISFVDTDSKILEKSSFDQISQIFELKGENFFRKLEEDCINEIKKNRHGKIIIVATGGGLPAIPNMMSMLNSMGITIYLKASLETLWKRLSTDPKQLDDRPLLKENGKEMLKELIERRKPLYDQSTIIIDTDQLGVNDVCRLMNSHINSLEKTSKSEDANN